MKALVTGASGFIGSTLIEELNTLGFEVHALMRATSSAGNLEGLKFRKVVGSLSDFESLKNAVADVEYVFHLAGVTAAPNRAAFFDSNAQGTGNLARAVAETRPGLTRFVYVSSLAAAGPAKSLSPRTETEADAPVSAYGESKLAGEKELLKYKDVFPVSIIRPPIVYGPKDKGVFVIIRTISRNFMPILKGSSDGHKYYSTIHVKDLCRGVVQAGLAPKDAIPTGEIFFLSGDGFCTYQELLSMIAEKLNRDPIRIKIPKAAVVTAAAGLSAAGFLLRRNFPFNWDKLNEVLPDFWICSNQKAKSVLGFAPEYDLGTGISDAIEWYQRQRWI